MLIELILTIPITYFFWGTVWVMPWFFDINFVKQIMTKKGRRYIIQNIQAGRNNVHSIYFKNLRHI